MDPVLLLQLSEDGPPPIVWVENDEHVFIKADLLSCTETGLCKIRYRGQKSKSSEICCQASEIREFHPTHDSAADDLSSVERICDAAILQCISMRFRENRIYTALPPLILSINPFKAIPDLYSANVYSQLPAERKRAHLFHTAESALSNILARSTERSDSPDSQSIVVSGESGAGKTEACKYMLRYLLHRASEKAAEHASNDGNTLSHRHHLEGEILACSPILESFGNSTTLRNDNSSRFGKYLRLRLNSVAASVEGADLAHYILEKGRVIEQIPQERNFHVFYELLNGLDKNELGNLYLSQGMGFRYLVNGLMSRPHGDDKAGFAELVAAFDSLGVSPETRMGLFRILASILHIGNITLTTDSGSGKVHVVESKFFKFILDTFGVTDLEKLLTTKTISSANRASSYTVDLTELQTTSAAAALAKDIYDRMFSWLVRQCNKTLMCAEPLPYIGILDIFGFEVRAFGVKLDLRQQ